MLKTLKSYLKDFSHLFFPHNCLGCGSDVLEHEQLLCMKCFYTLPETGFFAQQNNILEKKFYGRIKIEEFGSAFYFTKDSLIQTLLFDLKYRNNTEAGTYLGKLTGYQIRNSGRFQEIDVIVPLPLNNRKFKQRGYNQAALIADGIASVLQKPVIENAVTRLVFTESQTHKGRISRWQTMEGVFKVINPELIEGKHILLVDDVVTTGATIEACAIEILKVQNTKLSGATAGYTI